MNATQALAVVKAQVEGVDLTVGAPSPALRRQTRAVVDITAGDPSWTLWSAKGARLARLPVRVTVRVPTARMTATSADDAVLGVVDRVRGALRRAQGVYRIDTDDATIDTDGEQARVAAITAVVQYIQEAPSG